MPATFGAPMPVAILLSGNAVTEKKTYPYGSSVGTFTTVGGQPGEVFTFELTSQRAATVLAKRYQLERYVVEAYRDISAGSLISAEQLEALTGPLNQQEFPRDIIDTIASLPAILETIIYDLDGSLLLRNQVVVEGVFEVAGNELRVVAGSQSYGDGTFDRESISGYEIGIRARSQQGFVVDQTFIIDVTDVNEAPVAISLSPASIPENEPAGSMVGNFATSDPDFDETFAYRLVTGEGSDDNGWFVIDGSTLKTAAFFDFEGRDSYSIRVRSTDSGGFFTEKAFTITVTDVDEAPTAVTVTGVYVRGSSWVAGFLARLPFTTLDGEPLGWQLPDGLAQLATASSVSWNNVDVLSVQFDQPIAQPAVDALQLVLGTAGGNQTIVPTALPTLLAGGTVAQWTLPASLTNGRYVISIAAAGITNVEGTATLDGEWTTWTSTFAMGSGDGSEGGTFNFFFNVLVGDVNGDGIMNAGDLSAIRNSLTSPMNTPLAADGSNYRLDIDGTNSLNASDLSKTRAQLASALGTTLASLLPVTAPAESATRSMKSFAALAEESEGTLASGLSAEAWAWYAIGKANWRISVGG